LSLIEGGTEGGHGSFQRTFPGVALATGPVQIDALCLADLAGSSNWLDIKLSSNGSTWTLAKRYFQSDGHTDCYSPYTADYAIEDYPASSFNNLVTSGTPGTIYLRAEYSFDVQRYCDACTNCYCYTEPRCNGAQTHGAITEFR